MSFSTGLTALDQILQGILPGDNIVWSVDTIADYRCFVEPFARHAKEDGHRLVYFRFASHEPLVPPDVTTAEVHALNPAAGFEKFITDIHHVIEKTGRGAYYISDCMSDLADNCYSDRMIGNFFKLTCPYLFKMETLAFFGIYRHIHSYHATNPIEETTQILLDVYRNDNRIHVQPSKVAGRYSPTLYMLHSWEPDAFVPVTESAAISDVLSSSPWPGLKSASYRMIGIWDKQFMHAEEVLESLRQNACTPETAEQVVERLIRLIVSSDERIQKLAAAHFSLQDMIFLWKRMIGTGMIGGKSAGMLLARAILRKRDPKWIKLLESHDSFFIGSDVFYSFLVDNGCWWERQKQKDPETFLNGVKETREKILKGEFPDYIVSRFTDMLNYFGQSPIIVRSSSLLEDNFGNAFAGKYDSVFCANQGTHQQRLESFINAVRNIYASTMSAEALSYRAKRGVLDKDEQMALLIQRVSGAPYCRFFFPQLAGVAFSFNPYAWSKQIDPEAGMMRLVFGLGTRAVDRSDDDYTRVVALNAPEIRPEASFNEVKRYAQRRVDALDLESNTFVNTEFVDIIHENPNLPLGLFAIRDPEVERYYREHQKEGLASWILTFDELLLNTNYPALMREMLKTLHTVYGTHVDVEFTTNFLANGSYKINIVQCRPLQIKETDPTAVPFPAPDTGSIILETHGGVVGQSRKLEIDRILYVVPALYGLLSEPDRYAVARLIGRLTRLEGDSTDKRLMLLGPGRWGTSTASLGIPVSFSEIHKASVLCEIDSMHEGLVPDLSLGTHFFNEMVEMNINYLAYFGAQKENRMDTAFLEKTENRLVELLPDAARWAKTVRVIDAPGKGDRAHFYLIADTVEQKSVLYFSR
ncbi:MAG: PEP/pyruvate-binding domain-containing protein [Fibrobacterota bacterium]